MTLPERLDLIAPLWAEKISTPEIGRRLGIKKNTLCRMVFDARKKGDVRFPIRGFNTRYRQENRTRPRREKRVPLDPPFVPDLSHLVALPPRPASSQGQVSLMDLRHNECRYPTVTLERRGEYFFCGAPKDPNSESYCKKHDRECRSGLGVRLHRFART
jgi:hypothetical protein